VTDNFTREDADDITLLDLLLIFAENWRTILLLPISAGIAALGFTFLLPPTYTASTRILPPAQQNAPSSLLSAQLNTLAGLAGGTTIRNPADQYIALLKSRSVYDPLIQRFNLKELYEARYTEDARKVLESRTRFSAGLKDGVISIEVDDHDAKRAADIANGFVEELRNLSKTLAITEAAQRRLFFETQVKQTRDSLTAAERALRGSGVSEAVLKTMPQSTLEVLARLKAQMTAQEIKLASMRMFMTESNPELKLAIQELAALRSELSKAEQSNMPKAAGSGGEYIAKYRDYKYHEALFELMVKQYELARLDEAREGTVIQVIDEALVPERRSKPNRSLIAGLTTAVAFLLTVLFVLARQAIRGATSSPTSAQKLERLRRLLAVGRS
jgi:tyrosine-protein kinase Etk/Wzc